MAMKSGKPVYVEKPLAQSYEECVRVNNVSKQTGVPCFVAYYRRYLPYFQRVKQLVDDGVIGRIMGVQIRFAVPPRDLDYNRTALPWRVQRDIAGGGYFYDLAPHQLDLIQEMFGPITRASGFCSNRGGLYDTEDTVSAAFQFADGLPGSGTWSFCAQLCFSVFTYQPIALHTSQGRQEIVVENPPHVQMSLIQRVVEHLQGRDTCTLDSVSATSVNWVMDRILGKM